MTEPAQPLDLAAPCGTCTHPQGAHHPHHGLNIRFCLACYDTPDCETYSHPWTPAEVTTSGPLDLAPIQARVDAASPGPWWNDSHEIYAGPTDNTAGSDWVGETCRVNDPAGSDADGEFIAYARQDVPALITEVERLLAENERLAKDYAAEERYHGQTMAERDNLHDIADQLAAAIAPVEVIGEHSSHNCPWQNALDYALNRPA